jgi:hypothetical protein
MTFQCENLLRSKFQQLTIRSAVFDSIISIGFDLFYIYLNLNDQLLFVITYVDTDFCSLYITYNNGASHETLSQACR